MFNDTLHVNIVTLYHAYGVETDKTINDEQCNNVKPSKPVLLNVVSQEIVLIWYNSLERSLQPTV